MKDQRPVYLNLFEYRFPITAIISILHRVSGAILFFSIPFILCALDHSLLDRQGFYEIKGIASNLFFKVILWGFFSALIYHVVAGFRHLLMDCHIGETKEGGRLGAQLTLGISIVLIALLGIGIFLC